MNRLYNTPARGLGHPASAGKLAALILLTVASAPACSDDGPGSAVDASPPETDARVDVEFNPNSISLIETTYELGEVFNGGGTGVRASGVGSGAAVADIDNDGDLDVFLARCDGQVQEGGPSLLLRNMGGDGAFPTFVRDVAMESQFADQCAHAAAFGDYDGDGAIDLYVVLEGPDRLYRNDGTGAFTDVAAAAGVVGPEFDMNTSAYWVDVNHDGLLDLFVPHHVLNEPAPSPINGNRLYLNRGDGTFESVAEAAGVAGDGSTQAAAIADIDGDGELELYLANDQFAVGGQDPGFGIDADRLHDPVAFDDRGVPTYQDLSATYGMDGPRSSMGVALGDVNQDGYTDIYVSDIGINHLQVWNPDSGTYEQRAEEFGLGLRDALLEGELVAWDAEFVDLDRDGREELSVIHGSITMPLTCADYTQFDAIVRYIPEYQRYFDISPEVGLSFNPSCAPQDDRPINGRGLVWADLDGDDDNDLIVTPYIEEFRFYRNDTPAGNRHFVRVRPVGTVSAPTPIGAALEVTLDDGTVLRRLLYAGGNGTQRDGVLEVGLGANAQVASAILRWPSGYAQHLHQSPDFALDTTWQVTEPAWLSLSARAAGAGDPAPQLVYRPVDDAGAFVGAAAAGRSVTLARSDGVSGQFADAGDGSYTAALDHPGAARITIVQVTDGQPLRPRLSVNFQ